MEPDPILEEIHAIREGPVYTVTALPNALEPQRLMQSESVPGCASFPIGCYDGDLPDFLQSFG